MPNYFPKGTDRSGWQADELEAVTLALSDRPRRTLGWKTPAEALNEHLPSVQEAGVATTGCVRGVHLCPIPRQAWGVGATAEHTQDRNPLRQRRRRGFSRYSKTKSAPTAGPTRPAREPASLPSSRPTTTAGACAGIRNGGCLTPQRPVGGHQGTRPAHTLGVFVTRAPGFEVSSRHNPSSRSRTQAMSQRVVQAIMCFWLRPPAFDDLSGGRGPQSALVKRRTSPRRRLDRPLPVGSVLLTGYTTWRDVNRTMSLSGGRRGKQAPQRQPYLFATEPSTPIRRGFPESSPERPLGAALADAWLRRPPGTSR